MDLWYYCITTTAKDKEGLIVSQPLMKSPEEGLRYTYDDYYSWDDGQRWELIDGAAYLMSPAPSWNHQGVLVELIKKISLFLEGRPCKVYPAPFDVRLNADAGDNTVVQPDIVVICDLSRLDERGGYRGAPEMVVEILSPSSARRDKLVKFNQYQKAGVREYWIVDPDTKTVSAHILENGKYIISAFGDEDIVPVHVLEGCEIDLSEVFE